MVLAIGLAAFSVVMLVISWLCWKMARLHGELAMVYRGIAQVVRDYPVVDAPFARLVRDLREAGYWRGK